MSSLASTQFASSNSATGQATTSGASTGGTAQVDVASENKLWESIVVNVKEILRETDKILPAGAATAAAPAPAAPAQAAGRRPRPRRQLAAAPQPSVNYIEAASVIANRESGILYVRATSRQHEKVQEFLDQVLVGAKRQVLIEATVAEVQLNNQYQRGIDWQRLRGDATTIGRPGFGTGRSGIEFGQNSTGTPAAVSTTAFVLGGAITSLELQLRAHPARVLRRRARAVEPEAVGAQQPDRAAARDARHRLLPDHAVQPDDHRLGRRHGDRSPSFTTTPTGRRRGLHDERAAADQRGRHRGAQRAADHPAAHRRRRRPQPGAHRAPNLIPIFETREFDSILRLQSGQVAVLGGLMQDQARAHEDTIPGINQIPGLGELSRAEAHLNIKTELVIFLRATVIRDASVEGDFRAFRGDLPGEDFLSRPNPARVAPPIGPGSRNAERGHDMSLLLEALKKAEKAKEDAQRRARGETGEAPPRERRRRQPDACAGRAEAGRRTRAGAEEPASPRVPSCPTFRRRSKSSPTSCAPRRRRRASCGWKHPGRRRASRRAQRSRPPRAAERDAQKTAARKVFEAKFKEPNPKLPFFITVGVLGVFAVGVVVYFWWQLRPPLPAGQHESAAIHRRDAGGGRRRSAWRPRRRRARRAARRFPGLPGAPPAAAPARRRAAAVRRLGDAGGAAAERPPAAERAAAGAAAARARAGPGGEQ